MLWLRVVYASLILQKTPGNPHSLFLDYEKWIFGQH